MVFPLFAMALVWDRARLGERRWLRPRTVRFTVAGHRVVTTTLNVGVAVAFAVMGGFVIALASSRDMTGGTAVQDAAARGLTSAFLTVERWVAPLPEVLLGVGLLAVAAAFVWFTLADRRRRPGPPAAHPADVGHGTDPVPQDGPSPCHEPATTTPHQNGTSR